MSDGFIGDNLMLNCFVQAWSTEKSNYSPFQKKSPFAFHRKKELDILQC